MKGRAVFLNAEASLSASGRIDELFRDYDIGATVLRPATWSTPNGSSAKILGTIPEKILGALSDPWDSPIYPRWQECLDILLNDLAANLEDRTFDAVLVSRPRLKAFNPRFLRQDLDSFMTTDQFEEWLANRLDQHGIHLRNEVVVSIETSCTTGATLLGHAQTRVARGIWNRVLLLAFDPISPSAVMVMDSLGVISQGRDESYPRVFHAQRDGFFRAEAFCAAVVSARHELGGRVPVVVRHVAFSNDSSALTAIDSDGEGLRRCIDECLTSTGLAPERISFVKAHGTGTRMNDQAESQALRSAAGQALANTPVICFKSQFGHTMNAGALFELALTANCLREGKLMPVRNCQPLDPDLGLNVVVDLVTARHFDLCLGMIMGFGGVNSAYILERGHT